MTDQIKQLVERLRSGGLKGSMEDQAADLIDRLSAENDEFRRDAERYRWLREQHESLNLPTFCVFMPSDSNTLECIKTHKGFLDKAIDSAIAAKGEVK